jgi:5-methylcytosine-specific restriction endonuclease McrA
LDEGMFDVNEHLDELRRRDELVREQRRLRVEELTVTRGGGNDLANLAAVCSRCHRRLAPQGPWMLAGNPNLPHGLQLVPVTEWRGSDPRAGP